jgi:hypothetical protein
MIVMAKRINVSYRILGTFVTLLYVGTISGNHSSGSLLITTQIKVKFRFRAPAMSPPHTFYESKIDIRNFAYYIAKFVGLRELAFMSLPS